MGHPCRGGEVTGTMIPTIRPPNVWVNSRADLRGTGRNQADLGREVGHPRGGDDRCHDVVVSHQSVWEADKMLFC